MGLSKLTDPGLLTFSDRHLKKKSKVIGGMGSYR